MRDMRLQNVFICMVWLAGQAAAEVLVEADFRQGVDALNASGLVMLDGALPGTGIRETPHRSGQEVPRALVRDLREAPLWPDGRLQITRNEVQQGAHRLFAPAVPLDPSEQVLVMRVTTFSDASTGGSNSVAVRLWVQEGLGPNHHRDRLELSTHFNPHPRGSRQVYPNAYTVRDGWETWAMPEGTNSRRAGIYYRLGAEGRNEEIRGPLAVPLGIYWTWDGLNWPKGWAPPLGGGLYEPPARDAAFFPGDGLYTTTAVWARSDRALAEDPHRFASRVDVLAPRSEGRIVLEAPLPAEIDEVRLLLRSERPGGDRDWLRAAGREQEDPLYLGVAEMHVALRSRADVNLDGAVDSRDWDLLRNHAGKAGALHVHGDVTGDGSVGLRDGFFLAARMPAGDDTAIPPEAWRAYRDTAGHLRLRIPPGGRLYGWALKSPSLPLASSSMLSVYGDTALREQTDHLTGEMDLMHPVYNPGESALYLDLGALLGDEISGSTVRIQTRPGREALTLPVWSPPESKSFQNRTETTLPIKETQ